MMPLVVAALLAQAVASATCPPCQITLERVTVLGDEADPVSRSALMQLGRLSNGNYVMAPLSPTPQVALYAPDGRLIRLYERTGQGPGELSGMVTMLAVGPGDSIHIAMQNRVLSFGPDLARAHTRPLEFSPRRMIALPGGRFFVSHPVERDRGATYALHLLNAAGQIAASQDALSAPSAGTFGIDVTRTLARSRNGGIWAMSVADSYLDWYSPTGQRGRRLAVQRPWFQPWRGDLAGEGTRVRRRPRTEGILELDSTRVALVTLVPDSKWAPTTETLIRANTDLAKENDTVVELVELSSGKVIATRRFDESLLPVKNSTDLLYASRELDSGDIQVTVYRLKISAQR